jgi:hypothetical protein
MGADNFDPDADGPLFGGFGGTGGGICFNWGVGGAADEDEGPEADESDEEEPLLPPLPALIRFVVVGVVAAEFGPICFIGVTFGVWDSDSWKIQILLKTK